MRAARRGSRRRRPMADAALTLPSLASGRGFSPDLAAEMQAIGAAARDAAAPPRHGIFRKQDQGLASGRNGDPRRVGGADRGQPAGPRRGARAKSLRRHARPPAARREAHRRRWRAVSRRSPRCPIRSATSSREWTRPNGLRIQRVSVPLGVIGIIYESRPNVTADAGGLCLKSGNAAILRGGSESFHSSGGDRRLPAPAAWPPPGCRRRRSSSCRRATAPRSG